MTTIHAHQCGRVSWGMLPNYGCGHIWEHEAGLWSDNAEKAATHKCPKCGCGPFFYQVSPDEIMDPLATGPSIRELVDRGFLKPCL